MHARAAFLVVFVFLAIPVSAQFASEQQRRDALRSYADGERLMAAERFTDAVDAFQRAIDADRLFARAYYRQGQAYMALRWFASAVKAFRDCRDAYGSLHDEARMTELQGRVEATAGQRAALARPFITPAEVSLALGSAYFRNGQIEDAEREWKAAVAVNGRFSEAHNNLAALYAMTGRKKEAEDAVRAAERAGFRVHPQLKDDIRAITNQESQVTNR